MVLTMEYTGERMVPGLADLGTFWEHVARYRFAGSFVSGRDVVDVACGEGYGTAGLRKAGARTVIGIDVSEEAVLHAQRKYHVDARHGSAEAIPLPDSSVDVIVSFETIEHVPNPSQFLSECVRILRTSGTLIMSTPNVQVYHGRVSDNPFHCSEMRLDDFAHLVENHFSKAQFYGQTGGAPWYLRRRGVRRVCRMVKDLLGVRTLPDHLDDAERMAELCARRQGIFEQILCTDAVSRRSLAGLRESMYAVVVAHKK